MGNQVKYCKKMINLFKHKNSIKIGMLLSSIALLYCYFFLFKSSNFEYFKKTFHKGDFSFLKDDFSDFFLIKKVKLYGRSKTDLYSIEKIILSKSLYNTSIIKYDSKEIKVALEKLKWIKNVSIKKNFPETINIIIDEHKSFAILKEGKKYFLISDEGKIIHKISEPKSYDIIQIEGVRALNNIENIKEFLEKNQFLQKKIARIIILPNNRWNLLTNRNVLFKLPINNKQQAINKMDRYLNIKNAESVDLRFLDKKIYLKMKKNELAMKKK